VTSAIQTDGLPRAAGTVRILNDIAVDRSAASGAR
jgi:hypothetical protein